MTGKLASVVLRVGVNTRSVPQDAAAIQAGTDPLMARSKLFVDSNGLGADGGPTDLAEVAEPDEVEFECSANGRVDLRFRGDGSVIQEGTVFELGDQGLRMLSDHDGCYAVIKYLGQGSGTGTASVRVAQKGIWSEPWTAPKAD